MNRKIIRLVLLASLCASRLVMADTIFGVEIPDTYVPPDPGEPIKELPLTLPSPPDGKNLLKFDVSESFSFNYYIDPDSLSFGEDGIMRYTAVIISKRGAKTVVYEGMKCTPREARRYAELDTYAENGQWQLAKNNDWQTITSIGTNNYRFALYNDYWCHIDARTRSVKDMIKALKRGGYRPTESSINGYF